LFLRHFVNTPNVNSHLHALFPNNHHDDEYVSHNAKDKDDEVEEDDDPAHPQLVDQVLKENVSRYMLCYKGFYKIPDRVAIRNA
jgi:hypothetical protein